MLQRLGQSADFHVTQTAFRFFYRPLKQFEQILPGQRAQLENLGAGNQRRIHKEEGVVSRGPNQPHDTALHIGQENILLRFIETMNLVYE